MADQTTLQVDKIIITRQNPIDETERIPEQLDYGQLAIDIKGNLYTGDKNNNVVSAGGSGGGREWSEIDNQTAAEPPNPREADQLNGYKATDIIKEAVKQASEIDILLPTEPDSPRQADQLGGYSAENLIEKAVQSVTLIDELTMPEPENIKDADTLNGLSSNEIIKNNGINLYTHSKVGTVHNFSGSGINGRAKMTANVETGDTFTVNGIPVTAYMGSDGAVESMTGSEWNDKWITFIFDGTTINFKGGGGVVTAEGLSADALLAGKIVNIKRGNQIIDTIIGTLLPNAFYISTTPGDVVRAGNGDSTRSFKKPNAEKTVTVFTAFPIIADDYFGFAVFGKTEASVTNAAPSQYQGTVYSVEVDNTTIYVYDGTQMARSDKPTITKAEGGNVDLSIAFFGERAYITTDTKIDTNIDLLKMIKVLLD